MYLKARLPEYMVPSAFVMLNRMPLTLNGKINRRALPPPEFQDYANCRYEAPRGEVEEFLSSIWRELLRVEKVGRYDSFFDLGGHSLLATRVISRVRELTHVELPLRSLFESPTLEQLALLVSSQRHAQVEKEKYRTESLTEDLSRQISEMSDAAVLEYIATLERELDMRGTGG
jgi:acyl carrier protein